MVLGAFLLAVTASSAPAPGPADDFARYPVPVARRLPVVAPRLADARARGYRTALRAAARRRPDFAGHWVLATIGCGASYIQPVAVDRATGRLVWFPGTICCWPLAVVEPLGYRVDSRLLTVEGELNEQAPAATRRYLFEGRRFVALPF